MTRAQASLGLLLSLFLCHLLNAQNIVQVVIPKCCNVVDTVSGAYGTDSSFSYYGPYVQYVKGVKYVEGAYRFGKMTGMWKKYHLSNGNLSARGQFNDGVPHGLWKFFYSTDTLSSICYFNNGVKAGTWKGFGRDGKKFSEVEFNADGKESVRRVFYKDGGLAFVDTIIYDGEKQFTSTYSFYNNGKLFESAHFENGGQIGEYIKYYKSGVLWEHFVYKNDLIYKVLAVNDRSGKDKGKDLFKDGTGELNRYHVNGNLSSKSIYHSDYTNFDYTCYDKGMGIFSSGKINNGVNSGIWKTYNSGKTDGEFNFVDGSDHYFVKWYGGGVKTSELEYKHHKLFGQRRYFDYFGKCISTINYDYGQLNGYCEIADGEIVAKGTYKLGNPVGKWSFEQLGGQKRVLHTKVFTDSVYFDTAYYKPNTANKNLILIGHATSDFDFDVEDDNIYGRVSRFESQTYLAGTQESLLMGDFQDQMTYYRSSKSLFFWPNTVVTYKSGLIGELIDLKVRKTFYSELLETDHVNTVIQNLQNSPFLETEFSGFGLPVIDQEKEYVLDLPVATKKE